MHTGEFRDFIAHNSHNNQVTIQPFSINKTKKKPGKHELGKIEKKIKTD